MTRLAALLLTLAVFCGPAAAWTARQHHPSPLRQAWARQYHRANDLQRRLTRRVHETTQLRGLLERERRTRSLSAVGSSSIERDFLCIHAGEGSWTDPDAPYYGGLQMDLEFQKTYGPEYLRAYGTAGHWPVAVQMAVAIKAYLSGRGFYPWPNTARACGLIR